MLEGSRVTLAPLRPEDSVPMFEWINDRELVLLSSSFEPVAEEDHRRWFERIQSDPGVEIFAIRLREDDSLVGSCQLRGIDRERGRCELQIRIGDRRAWGRGYGTEAVELLVRHGFEDLALRRIELEVFATNKQAIGAYEKAGFRREGVQRGGAVIEGEPVDVVGMATVASGEAPDGV